MCHHCGAHATPPKFSELVMFWWFMVLSNIWKRKYIIRARGAHPFHNNWHASCHNTDPSRHNTHASRHNSHPCSPMNDFHMTAYRTRVSPRRLPCHNLVQYVHLNPKPKKRERNYNNTHIIKPNQCNFRCLPRRVAHNAN